MSGPEGDGVDEEIEQGDGATTEVGSSTRGLTYVEAWEMDHRDDL
jgi:hypothetical protein